MLPADIRSWGVLPLHHCGMWMEGQLSSYILAIWTYPAPLGGIVAGELCPSWLIELKPTLVASVCALCLFLSPLWQLPARRPWLKACPEQAMTKHPVKAAAVSGPLCITDSQVSDQQGRACIQDSLQHAMPREPPVGSTMRIYGRHPGVRLRCPDCACPPRFRAPFPPVPPPSPRWRKPRLGRRWVSGEVGSNPAAYCISR